MVSSTSSRKQLICRILLPSVWLLAFGLYVDPAAENTLLAHDEYKDPMEQRYKLKSISCKACHTDNKDKSVMNAFGKLLRHELKPKEVTKRLEAAKAEGEEAKKAYEKQMVQDFLIALDAVEKKKLTFAALLNAGLLYGVRLDPKQVDTDAMTVKLIKDPPPQEAQPEKPRQSQPVSKDPSQAATPTSSESAPVIEGEVKKVPIDEPQTSAPVEPVPSVETTVETAVETTVEPVSPSEPLPPVDSPATP